MSFRSSVARVARPVWLPEVECELVDTAEHPRDCPRQPRRVPPASGTMTEVIAAERSTTALAAAAPPSDSAQTGETTETPALHVLSTRSVAFHVGLVTTLFRDNENVLLVGIGEGVCVCVFCAKAKAQELLSRDRAERSRLTLPFFLLFFFFFFFFCFVFPAAQQPTRRQRSHRCLWRITMRSFSVSRPVRLARFCACVCVLNPCSVLHDSFAAALSRCSPLAPALANTPHARCAHCPATTSVVYTDLVSFDDRPGRKNKPKPRLSIILQRGALPPPVVVVGVDGAVLSPVGATAASVK